MTRRLRFDTPPTTPPTILAEADNIAGEDRSRDYGHPLINHQRIAAIWNVQLGEILKSPITPRQAALMMIGLKCKRIYFYYYYMFWWYRYRSYVSKFTFCLGGRNAKYTFCDPLLNVEMT